MTEAAPGEVAAGAGIPGAAHPEKGQWRRLSPLTMAAQMLRTLANLLLPLAAVGYGAASEFGALGAGGVLIIGPVILGLSLVGGWLGWLRQRYLVGAADVRLEQGIISRSARSVPFERIQDVSLEQAFIPRLLGLVEVRFETGAGGKDDLKLAFVTEAEGEVLRETVRARAEGPAQDADAATPAEPEEQAETLFAMDNRRLLTFGVFEFSLVVFAVLAGFAQQFEFLLPFEPWDIDAWEERLAGPGAWLAGLGAAARVAGFALVLAGFVVIGLATGIVRTVLRDYGFRLERTAKGFRRRRGLLTRTDVVMPVHRVQAVRVSTGILRRVWGWHGLAFISLAQDAGSANHDVAPFARLKEIGSIARAAQFTLPGEDTAWQRPVPRYYADRAVLAALLPGLAAITAILLDQVLAGLALGLLGALLVIREYWLWHHARHALDPRQVLSRRGWLAPRLLVASRVKLHSVEIAQGPLGRWRGYASLRFGLAGGALALHGLAPDEARAMRAAVLESIAAVDFAQLPR